VFYHGGYEKSCGGHFEIFSKIGPRQNEMRDATKALSLPNNKRPFQMISMLKLLHTSLPFLNLL
jgi:hypothetical protein